MPINRNLTVKYDVICENIKVRSNTCSSNLNAMYLNSLSSSDFQPKNEILTSLGDLANNVVGSVKLSNGTISLDPNVAYVTATLSQFASTTSDQLGGIITEKTGFPGSLVFNNSPTLNAPNIHNGLSTLDSSIDIFTTANSINIGSSTSSIVINKDLSVTGNLTVSGTTTSIDATTVSVADINIELGKTDSPTDATAANGGITLKGTTDKTITWGSTNGWTSSESLNLSTGKTYKINGVDVLSNTTLGSDVVSSSLTSVGTITSGTWSGSFGSVSGANLTSLTAANLTGTIPSTVLGNSTHYIGTTAVTLNRASANLGLTGISSIALPGSTSGTITLTPTASAGTTTITFPATSGTVITTGDTGTVTSTMIADGTIVNADISDSAAIATSKINGLAASATTDTTNASNINSGTLSNGRLTSVLGSIGGLANTGTGLVKLTNGTASIDSSSYLTGNQNITVSGDASGSGKTSIELTLANTGVTAGDYGSNTSVVTVSIDSKGRITNASSVAVTPSWSSITNKPTNLFGYGINDAASINGNSTQNFNTKSLTVTGDILPTTTNTYNIGNANTRFAAIYVNEAHLSTNTLYIGDTPILGTSAQTINIHADPNQSIDIQTSGTGVTTIESAKGTTVTTTGMNADVFLNATGSGSNVRIGATNELQVTAGGANFNCPVTMNSGTVSGNLTISGNLTVNGTQSVINSTVVAVKDNIVVYNSGEVGSGVTSGKAGIQIDRGDLSDYQLVFDESDDMFKMGAIGSLETLASQPWVITNFSSTSHNHSIDGLNNVTISGKSSGDLLKWNGTSWVNFAPNYISGNQSITVSGDASGSGTTSVTLTLANTGVASGSYGSANAIPVITVDSKGRLTSVSTTSVDIPSSSISFTGDVSGSGSTGSSTSLTLANTTVTSGSYGSNTSVATFTVDSKGRLSAASNITIAPKWASITSKPTTLTGYGITDAASSSHTTDYTLHLTSTQNNWLDEINVSSSEVNYLAGVTSNIQTQINTKENSTNKGVSNGYASLDNNGKVPTSQLPDSVLGQLEYQGTRDMSVALPTASSENKGYYYITSFAGNGYEIGDWAVSNGTTWDKVDNTDAVSSVAGKTGVVSLTNSDVGLGNVDNTSDANKPISTATQTALDLKAPLENPALTGTSISIGSATGNTTVNNNLVANTISLGNADLKSIAKTINTNNTTVDLDSISATTYCSIQYLAQVIRTTGTAEFNLCNLYIIHDGSNVYISETGQINKNAPLGTFDANLVSGNIVLQYTGYGDATVNNITVKLVRTAIKA